MVCFFKEHSSTSSNSSMLSNRSALLSYKILAVSLMWTLLPLSSNRSLWVDDDDDDDGIELKSLLLLMAVSRQSRVLVRMRGCCCCCFSFSAKIRSCSSLKLAKKILEYDKYLVPQGDEAGVDKGVAVVVVELSYKDQFHYGDVDFKLSIHIIQQQPIRFFFFCIFRGDSSSRYLLLLLRNLILMM